MKQVEGDQNEAGLNLTDLFATYCGHGSCTELVGTVIPPASEPSRQTPETAAADGSEMVDAS